MWPSLMCLTKEFDASLMRMEASVLPLASMEKLGAVPLASKLANATMTDGCTPPSPKRVFCRKCLLDVKYALVLPLLSFSSLQITESSDEVMGKRRISWMRINAQSHSVDRIVFADGRPKAKCEIIAVTRRVRSSRCEAFARSGAVGIDILEARCQCVRRGSGSQELR